MNKQKLNSSVKVLQEKYDLFNLTDSLIVHNFRSSKESLQRIIKGNMLENKLILTVQFYEISWFKLGPGQMIIQN